MMHSFLEHLEQEKSPLRIEVKVYVASCEDCDESFDGSLAECKAWVAEHREQTGHRV